MGQVSCVFFEVCICLICLTRCALLYCFLCATVVLPLSYSSSLSICINILPYTAVYWREEAAVDRLSLLYVEEYARLRLFGLTSTRIAYTTLPGVTTHLPAPCLLHLLRCLVLYVALKG